MPAGTVLDWSGWRPTDAQLQLMRDLGIVGCVRYPFLGPGTEWKTCYPDEYKRIIDAGLAIAFTPELSKSTWRGGRKAGLDIGKKSRDWVHNLGWPDGCPLHFAVDENVLPSELNLSLDFLAACGEGGGQGIQSCYGETMVIDAAFERGITRNGWRAAATSWDTNPSKHASMRQTTQHSYPFAGAYDENVILKADWGQHPAPTGADMAIPFTLYKDNSSPQKIWRVDAGGQSKVQVPNLQAVAFCFDQLQQIFGATQAECQVRDATAGEAKLWLDAIPVSEKVVVPPCPPCPPCPPATVTVDATAANAIAKAVGDMNAQRWLNG